MKLKTNNVDITCFILALIGMCGIGYTLLDSVQEIVTVILFFALLWSVQSGYINLSLFKISPSMAIIYVFYFLIIFSWSYSFNESLTQNYVIRYLLVMSVTIFTFNIGFVQCTIKWLTRFSFFVSLTVIFSSLFPSAFKSLFGWFFTSKDAVYGMLDQGLAVGIVGHNAYAAGIANLCIGFFIAKFFSYGKISYKDIVYFVVGLLAMLTTGKRIMLLSLAVSMFVLLLVKSDSARKRRIFKFVGAFIALFIALYLFIPAARRMVIRIIAGMGDTTFNNREVFWNEAVQLFQEKKLFGWGFGIFPFYDKYYGSGWGYYAHNQYYEVIAELGLVGLITFLLILIVFGFSTFSLVKKGVLNHDNDMCFCSTFILYYIIWFVVYGLTATPLYNYSQFFLFIVFCVFSLTLKKYDYNCDDVIVS